MAAEEVKGMERMLGGRKRQKREVKETRVDRWLSLPRKLYVFFWQLVSRQKNVQVLIELMHSNLGRI